MVLMVSIMVLVTVVVVLVMVLVMVVVEGRGSLDEAVGGGKKKFKAKTEKDGKDTKGSRTRTWGFLDRCRLTCWMLLHSCTTEGNEARYVIIARQATHSPNSTQHHAEHQMQSRGACWASLHACLAPNMQKYGTRRHANLLFWQSAIQAVLKHEAFVSQWTELDVA